MPTEKNKRTIDEFGFTEDDVSDEVMSLTAENFVEGPLSDYGGYKGEFWVFGKTINNTEVYIKVKIKDLNEDGDKQLTTLCISFHKSEKQLIYQFK